MANNSPKLPEILDTFHQEHWYLTKLLVLLCIIALTSVGSFSLAQHLLPQGSPVTTTPVPTYSDGVCDADPNQMQSHYLPLSSDTSSPTSNSSTPTNSSTAISTPSIPLIPSTPKSGKRQTAFDDSVRSVNAEMAFVPPTRHQAPAKPTLPPPTATPAPTPTPMVPAGWYTNGFTNDDAKYAEACAAQFVIDYHTFDYKNLASLEIPTSMLSAHAKKLFYLGGAEDTHNIHMHMLSTWQNTIQKLQQSQRTTVQQPDLLYITPHYSNYIVQVDVGYKLITEKNTEVQLSGIYHDTVILQSTSPSPKLQPNEQHGWEVEDWIDANA